MNDFFTLCLEAQEASNIESKLALMQVLRQNGQMLLERITFVDSQSLHTPKMPSYATFCTITHPTKIRRPKHLKSIQSVAKVLHSIVHIEYSAIDLALDALYRFRHMPLEYYSDWLSVALQEAEHFELLRTCLQSLGYEYGDFPVHTQLFDAQVATPHLYERMALLHRGLEANGLDANPFVTSKIATFEHSVTPHILSSLHIILRDEIEHVKKGDRWWRYASSNATPEKFIAILKKFNYLCQMPKILNIDARLAAGFSLEELNLISGVKSHGQG
ncbi:ferritin-like domain-containing protein [Helicobacter jaachi]|uniref:Ferritin-like domain-containing protein n=1 Tax=Helicobacter jaachi TaxID=1677920 RepID=A0A4U8TDV4_9HELI|nr:ferritin-like domain-containing protein [Helicobacter jaachi]TLD97488.1 ferritin-like domain-containing protein [Helicobacter jaachi]